MANTKNTFMNWVNRQMIHEAAGKDGKTFYNVSFPYSESVTGYASVSVSKGQVLDANKKDGTVNPAYASVLLGAVTFFKFKRLCGYLFCYSRFRICK